MQCGFSVIFGDIQSLVIQNYVFQKETERDKIQEIALDQIDDFPDHPFQVRLDEDMEQLVESIKERGLITPVIIRPKEDGRYRIRQSALRNEKAK